MSDEAEKNTLLKWLPLISMIGVFVLQTITVVWHASQLTNNQKHIKEDINSLSVAIKDGQVEQKKNSTLAYSVSNLESEIEDINTWIKENRFAFKDMERSVDLLEDKVKVIETKIPVN